MKVIWLGQNGLLFVSGKNKVLVDPYLTDTLHELDVRMERGWNINKRFLDISPDIIILTNSHLDHLDIPTLKSYIEKNKDQRTLLCCESAFEVIADAGIVGRYNNVLFDEGYEWTHDNLHIKAVRAYSDDKTAIGIIITDTSEDKKYYITSDTLYNEKIFASLPDDIDTVFLPINGEDGCMNMYDAERFAKRVGAIHTVPVHFGMFDDINPKKFRHDGAVVPTVYKIIPLEDDENAKRRRMSLKKVFANEEKTMKQAEQTRRAEKAEEQISTPVEAKSNTVEAKPAPVEAKPTPVEAKPTPVEVKAVPVEVKQAPAEIKPTPVEVKPIPAADNSASKTVEPIPATVNPTPVEVKPVAPVEVKPIPTADNSASVEVKPIPTVVSSAPVDVKPIPATVNPTLAEVKPVPANVKPMPVAVKPAPVEEKTAPVTERPAPIEVKIAPVTEKPAYSEYKPKAPESISDEEPKSYNRAREISGKRSALWKEVAKLSGKSNAYQDDEPDEDDNREALWERLDKLANEPYDDGLDEIPCERFIEDEETLSSKSCLWEEIARMSEAKRSGEPKAEEVKKEAPEATEALKEDTVRVEPTKAAPTKEEPKKDAPVEAEPVKAEPIKDGKNEDFFVEIIEDDDEEIQEAKPQFSESDIVESDFIVEAHNDSVAPVSKEDIDKELIYYDDSIADGFSDDPYDNGEDEDVSEQIDAYIRELENFERGDTVDFDRAELKK